MADLKMVAKKAETLTEVEVLQPITHDGTVFGRGLHKIEAELAKVFLAFRDPISKEPIAQKPVKKELEAGSTEQEPKA